MTDEDVSLLLIEDNPGDARLIEEMLSGTTLRVRDANGEGRISEGRPQIRRAKTLAEGIDAFEDVTADAVLLDLGLPDSNGLETLRSFLDAATFVPIVVLTGLADEEVGVEAIQTGAQDYLVKGEVTQDLLVRTLYHAIERGFQERARRRRRRELEALNRLNRIGQDITHAVISTNSRDAVERVVCERLVEVDHYRFAWIGGLDRRADDLDPRVVAGEEDGYLAAIRDREEQSHPGQLAIDREQTHVVDTINAHGAPWERAAAERGVEAVAAVPIRYEGFLQGVLHIYASAPGAFSDHALDVLGRLGDVIGHAITALERKDALLSESVLQLEFKTVGVFEELVALTSEDDATLSLRHVIVDERILVFAEANGIEVDDLVDAAERSDEIEGMRPLSVLEGRCTFELVSESLRPLLDAVSSHGGMLAAATAREGTLRFTVEFPTGRDKRQLMELVEEHCAGAVHHAQRTVDRSPDEITDAGTALEELTEKQRLALEAAYYGGFFEWPRQSNGQEIAERLDIAPATFSQHIRTVEQKIFSAIFEVERPAEPPAT